MIIDISIIIIRLAVTGGRVKIGCEEIVYIHKNKKYWGGSAKFIADGRLICLPPQGSSS
jgi:hypothetical protein